MLDDSQQNKWAEAYRLPNNIIITANVANHTALSRVIWNEWRKIEEQWRVTRIAIVTHRVDLQQ